MKAIPLWTAALFLTLILYPRSGAQEAGTTTIKPATDPQSEPAGTTSGAMEERFKALLSNATLAGRWAPLKQGELGDEKTGDKYQIVSVTKESGDNWTVRAKMKYRDQEMVIPVPVQMKFAGDTAIMMVDNLQVPGGGTYSARLMFYDQTYSGSWSGARGGGMIYGVITNDQAKPAEAK